MKVEKIDIRITDLLQAKLEKLSKRYGTTPEKLTRACILHGLNEFIESDIEAVENYISMTDRVISMHTVDGSNEKEVQEAHAEQDRLMRELNE